MQMYSEEFKKTAVRKFLSRGARSVAVICRETGASSQSLYKWAGEYGKSPGMEKDDKRPQDRSTAEKFKAVLEFDRLADLEKGAFLRREGFHTDHLTAWRQQMEAGLEPMRIQAATRSEMAELARENKELKKELVRKNAALAETTALLVLKKKADLIWGSGEGE